VGLRIQLSNGLVAPTWKPASVPTPSNVHSSTPNENARLRLLSRQQRIKWLGFGRRSCPSLALEPFEEAVRRRSVVQVVHNRSSTADTTLLHTMSCQRRVALANTRPLIPSLGPQPPHARTPRRVARGINRDQIHVHRRTPVASHIVLAPVSRQSHIDPIADVSIGATAIHHQSS